MIFSGGEPREVVICCGEERYKGLLKSGSTRLNEGPRWTSHVTVITNRKGLEIIKKKLCMKAG